jgi:prophage regulatory protein
MVKLRFIEGHTMPEHFLKLPRVIEQTALSRSEIYRRVNSREFPQPIQLGPRAIAWQATKIDEWIDQRIKAASK